MVNLLCITAWAFLFLVCVRMLRTMQHEPLSRGPALALLAIALLAVPLLFRPHETLLSGQDPGVYLNCAGAYARHGSLYYQDPLLAEVTDNQLPAFLFGHWGYGATKDSCLEIKDLPARLIGPRFPPLFSILLSGLMRTGPPFPGLYVIPIFAIFTGLALAVLAARLLRHPWAAPLAMLFYLATPMVIWHARAPRPEIIASFLGLAGFALCLHARQDKPWARWPDLLLGLLAVAIAPFFHITGWFTVAGAGAVMLAWIVQGRTDALLGPPLVLLSATGYLCQSWFVGDQHQLRRLTEPWLAHPGLPIALALGALAIPALIGWLSLRHQRRAARRSTTEYPWRWLASLAAITLIAICAWLILRTPPIAQRTFDGYDYHYIHPTDLRLVLVYFSRPIALLALAGLALLLVTRPDRQSTPARLALLAWTLPAALLIGNMQDFFMTRYMLTTLCPLLILGLTAAVTIPSTWLRLPASGAAAGAILVTALLVHNRLPLITVTEHRGMGRFLESFADKIHAEHGMLLAEYARLATPLEHLFDVPLLSLDNETRDDYRRAMEAWETIMARDTNQPAFFLTPFPPPISDRFTFTPVFSNTIDNVILNAGRFALPKGPASSPLTLFLYRMTRPAAPHALPYTRWAADGNTGIERVTRPRGVSWKITGVPLAAGTTGTVAFAAPRSMNNEDTLALFMHADDGKPTEAPLAAPADGAPHTWTPLGQGWGLLLLPATNTAAQTGIALRAHAALHVSDAWHLAGATPARLPLANTQLDPHRINTQGRGLRHRARLLVPTPRTGAAWLAMLEAPLGDAGAPATIIAHNESTSTVSRHALTADNWSWVLHPLPANGTDWTWFTLQTTGAHADRTPDQPLNPLMYVAAWAVLPAP